jgi:hypothetical protein
MDIAAAGWSILFFSIFVALILVGLLVFSYAAYSFFVVVSNTAVGCDEVLWPGEPIQDWFLRVWYLVWLVAVWAVPAGFLVSFVGLPRPYVAVAVAGFLWLLFPVGLLSSMSAESRMVVLRPVIVGVLLKHFWTTLRFYASSAVVVGACSALGYAALFGLNIRGFDLPVITVPLAAVACTAGGLIYARLLGRTAFMTGQSSSEEPGVGEAKPEAVAKPSGKKKPRPRGATRAYDPWAIPAKEPARKTKPRPSRPSVPEDEYGPVEGSYELMSENAPPTKPVPGHFALEPEAVEPYGVSVPAEPPSKLPRAATPEDYRFEEQLAAPRELSSLPDLPFVTGVYSFPFYPQSLRASCILAVGLLGVIVLVRLLLLASPL